MSRFGRKRVALAALVLALGAADAVSAQNSFRPDDTPASASSGPAPEGVCGPTTITHSVSQTITALNSVSCNDQVNGHTDNSYFRAFDLAAFGIAGDFQVCSVQVGVESSDATSGSQPIQINLSTSDPAFPAGVLTPIGSTSTSVADGVALTVVEFPVAGTAPAGSELVVEVFTPNGQTAGNFFFIGSNGNGQTGPGYIRAPDCGIVAPTPLSAIGFPNMHIVLNVIGTEVGLDADLDVTKTAAHLGNQIIYTIEVTNNGPSDATNVVVTDALPAEVTYVSDTCGGSNVPPWTWNIGNLLNGASVSCDITVTVNPDPPQFISNTASVSGDQNDPNPGNDSSTVRVDIAISVLEIPTVGAIGMAALALLLLVGAVFMLRRRSAV